MIATAAGLLRTAQSGCYGVGAFAVVNLETGSAVLEAAQATGSPVILLVGEESTCVLPYTLWIDALKEMAIDALVPVAIALDHGTSVEECLDAIGAGVTGVMFDGSGLPLDENIALTREVTRKAHAEGVSVEGEIGYVPGCAPDELENLQDCLSDPGEAARFVEMTGVDVLAIAIGTVHGLPLEAPCIDFERLSEIRQQVGVPLAVHGVSGTSRDDLMRCVRLGVQKFNVYSDMVHEAANRVQASLEGGDDIVEWLRAASGGFRDVAKDYMNLIGSAGHA
jgi:fructose-bisphosphate aldolase class II